MIKNKLREYRTKLGDSQTVLAKAVGTTERVIYAIEAENQDIHLSLALKLAKYFACTVDDLFFFSDENSEKDSIESIFHSLPGIDIERKISNAD